MTHGDDRTRLPGRYCFVWCPGCDELHQLLIVGEDGSTPQVCWTWDGNADRPTFNPSLLVRGGRQSSDHVCHSFIRAGQWQFLGDCTHPLAGRTVDMPPLPNWFHAAPTSAAHNGGHSGSGPVG